MARYDFRTPRLFVEAPLAADGAVPLDAAQANYLCNVLRLEGGAGVLAFNGRDGEWQAELERHGKKQGGVRQAALRLKAQAREQDRPADLHYAFAPLKHARLDYMVQKAVELGASRLQPVATRHTQMSRVNLERMRANAIEAAEQCGVLSIPEIGEPLPLPRWLEAIEAQRLVVFCDEDAPLRDPLAALAAARGDDAAPPLAVLIGPEGGFAEDERTLLLARANMLRLALGPRILRADTAAVAALALVQAALGDWR
jgi:16S rRNA (uracil1498-N3)-methyltransferase